MNVYGKKELELKRKNMCFVESINAESVADHVYSGQWTSCRHCKLDKGRKAHHCISCLAPAEACSVK